MEKHTLFIQFTIGRINIALKCTIILIYIMELIQKNLLFSYLDLKGNLVLFSQFRKIPPFAHTASMRFNYDSGFF